MAQSKMAGNAGLWRNAVGCIEGSKPIDGKDHQLYIRIVTETVKPYELFLQKLEDVWGRCFQHPDPDPSRTDVCNQS